MQAGTHLYDFVRTTVQGGCQVKKVAHKNLINLQINATKATVKSWTHFTIPNVITNQFHFQKHKRWKLL